MSHALESFRAVRWLRTFNLVLQAVLVITFFGGLNYLALHFEWRTDLTSHRRHSLAPETLSYLRALEKPVQIYVTLTDTDEEDNVVQAYHDMRSLLREFTFATVGNPEGRITVSFIDVFRNQREAKRLELDKPNLIQVVSGENRRAVTLDQLYRVENREKKAFRGEQAVTAAILDVSNPGKNVIYFLAGHGEMRPEDIDPARGLSALRDELRARNFTIGSLDLTQARRIPDDAALLIAAGPQGRFQPFEQELLRRYLREGAGRLALFLEPGRPTGLDDLCYDWGVLVDDVWVQDTGADFTADDGTLLLRSFAPHAITQVLLDYQIRLFVGPTRSVRADPGRALDDSLEVTGLIQSSDTAWGERSYRDRRTPRFDASADLAGPLTLAVAASRRRADNLPFSVRSGRLVVVGSADFLANARLGNAGSLAFILAAVNWSVDRDLQLGIPARRIEQFQLPLSTEELARLRFALMGGVPGVVGALGLIVYLLRRR